MRNVTMSIQIKTTLRLAMIGALALVAAACASRPKPGPVTTGSQGAGPAAESGGPVDQGAIQPIPGSVQDFVINVGDRVYFDFDQYQVRADAGPVLDAQAAWLVRYPAVRVRIEGNADE